MSRRGLIVLAMLAALMIVGQAVLAYSPWAANSAIVNLTWIEVPLYAIAVAMVLRGTARGTGTGTRAAVALILVTAAILRIMVVPLDPGSTDINRYVWDGRVQGAGINPYRYIPADPALTSLRDDDIYPDINRKNYAHTIYPPFAQIVFFLTTRISEQLWAMKTAMVAFDVIAILAIMALMKARDVPPARILIYAWHPVPIWEFASDGHVDAVAVAGVCLALLAAQRRRPTLVGIALGLATLTKVYPVLIAPALYRRWGWKAPVAGLATIVLCTLPYVDAGRKLIGFASGYSSEEGYDDGSGLYLWQLPKHLWPGLPQHVFALYWPAAALILVAIGLAILFRRNLALDLSGAFLLATMLIVLTSPHYAWYMAWLIPFLCFYPSWAVIWLTGAGTYMNDLDWPHSFAGGSFVYLPFFAIAALEAGLRARRRRPGAIVPLSGPP